MNIFENDTISIRSKKQAAEHIERRYGYFGWSLAEKKDDRLYGDITHMTFTRPHFIEHKDELQLLQVRLEIAYNDMGRFSYKRGLRASLFGSFSGLLAAAFVAGGILLFLLLGGVWPQVAGSLACACGVALGIICGIFTPRIYEKDKHKYNLLIEERYKKIEELCNRARALRSENG